MNNVPNVRYNRRISKPVMVGGVQIGGGAPVSVQTMAKAPTRNVEEVLRQIKVCHEAGVDIVRVTVNDEAAANAIADIVKGSPVPIVADIHFNHIYALKAIEAGVAKVRINPGNIGNKDRIEQVLSKAKEYDIPIRIGVNSGSLERDILAKHGHPTAEALYESAMRHVEIAQDFGFDNFVISVKSTNVSRMIEAYRLIAEKTDYPLHVGVTEAGTIRAGTIKSSIGIGTLLSEGIGDTIRVSLTDAPESEVEVGREILQSLDLLRNHIELISCPTCGRLEVNLIEIAKKIEAAVRHIRKPLKVAVMGCSVNGPGEAKEADLGVACGPGEALLFKKGQMIKKIKEEFIVSTLLEEIDKM